MYCIYFLQFLLIVIGYKGIDPGAEDTGQLCLFIDNLFDSVNGNVIKPSPGKELRSAVTLNSPHWKFWPKCLDVLSSMKYEINKTIPSVSNWIRTIIGMQLICKRLLKDGFKYVSLRNFNQDPIENFFGSIRSHGIRNINPTPANFISSFKALVINNFTSSHSVGANCEDDDCDGVLDNLKEFLFDELPVETVVEETDCNDQLQTTLVSMPPNNDNIITSGSRAYVSGWIIKKVKKLTKNCSTCIAKLCATYPLNEHFLIQERQYLQCHLFYPDKETIDVYSFIINLFNSNFHKYVYKNNAFDKLYSFVSHNVPIGNLVCGEHDLFKLFLKTACKLLIYSYVNHINRILSKGEKNNCTSDPIKLSAISYHDKYSKKKKVLLQQNVNYV